MTGLPISSAMALAPNAVSVTRPGVVGTLCLANSSFAWYSKRSMDSLSLCVDFEGWRPMGQGELYPHAPTPSAPPAAHVVDLTAAPHVIEITISRGIPPRVATNIGIWLTCLGLDNALVTTRGIFQVGTAPFASISSWSFDEPSAHLGSIRSRRRRLGNHRHH